MFRVTTLVLLSALLPQQCDFGGNAEKARQQAEDQIKPYFPNARAVIEGRNTLRILTCTNLGRPAIDLLPPTIEPKLKLLKEFRLFTGVNVFELGFDHDVLRYDLSTNRYIVISDSVLRGYAAEYKAVCSPGVSIPQEAQIYVGKFAVTVQSSANQIQSMEVIDTLGIYRPNEFNSARDSEVAARRAVMRTELEKRGLNVLGLELLEVSRLPAPDPQSWSLSPAVEADLRR